MKQFFLNIPIRIYLAICLAVILLVLILIPAEQTLGNGIRLIYLHAAWVWTGIVLYTIAGVVGLAAVFIRKIALHRWSAALGRTALLFWLTYLPMSLLVMQQNWNGLFFAEPRWSIPFSLAVASLLLQVGVFFINQPVITSIANLGFGTLLVINMSKLQSVLHPESAIQQSGSLTIKSLFVLLLVFTIFTGLLLTKLIHSGSIAFEERKNK